MENLKQNINLIKKKIADSAVKSGRDPEEIILVAVTKNVDSEIINEALDLGITQIGENRVQEILDKYGRIKKKDEIGLHLIGHLQTNKVKYIIDKIALIHSVDSIKLAEEISNWAKKIEKIIDILVQVNVSGEITKYGININECTEFVKIFSELPNIRVRGLMTIAPFTENLDIVRSNFRKLNEKFIDIKQKNIDNVSMDYLSMGMSNDFEIAIEEGANIVRVGTAIFGNRVYE